MSTEFATWSLVLITVLNTVDENKSLLADPGLFGRNDLIIKIRLVSVVPAA